MATNSDAPIVPGHYGSVQSITEVSTDKRYTLGSVGTIGERTFAYASSSGSAISLGALCAVAAPVANHVSVAYASGGAANTNTVTVTLGATAATENQYADGWLVPIDGTGQGQLRKIESHPAADSAATLELTVSDDFDTAMGTGEISLVKNEFADVVTHPGMAATTLNLAPVGVVPVAVPSGSTDTQFFWIQIGGPALVLKNGSTFVAGIPVRPADATADAGQVDIVADATTGTPTPDPIVGHVINVGDAASDGDHVLVRLSLG